MTKRRQVSRWALINLVVISVLIVTGAGVRLTGSGLGCSDWPNCSPGGFVQAGSWNQAIEQINRIITSLVAIPIVVVIVYALRDRPRRRDLVRLSFGLFAWLVGEAVLGGIVVLTHLHPAVVAAHFLLGLVGVVTAAVLFHRANEDAGPYQPTVALPVRKLALGAAAMLFVALALGTIVTGSGPHSGDEDSVKRFGFAITSATRVHSVAVWVFVGSLVGLAVLAKRYGAMKVVGGHLELLFLAALVQGTIGYVQYAAKLPAGLVAAHIAGAVAVTIATTRLVLGTRTPVTSRSGLSSVDAEDRAFPSPLG